MCMHLNDSKPMRFCSITLMVLIPANLVFSQTDDELVKVAKDAYEARWNATNKEERVQIFRQYFHGFSDDLKLKAILLRLYDVDQNPKWSMSSEIIAGPQYVFAEDPNFIADWSALREMLNAEKSPRKFYLLSKLAPWSNKSKQHDFVAERTHMLFEDGRVAKNEGEYTRPYAHVVSVYAYKAIVENLKALGADFEPPAVNLPHEEQAMILAKWLKGNWPGCENIEIPSRLLGGEVRPRKSSTEKAKPSPSRMNEQTKETPQEAKHMSRKSLLPWVISGTLLVGILLLLPKAIKGKLRP